MKRFFLFAFLGLAPADAFSQHSEFNIELPAITLYPAFGNPDMSASGIQFRAALEYLFYFDDLLGAGAVAGASFFSPQAVYPCTEGFVIAFRFGARH